MNAIPAQPPAAIAWQPWRPATFAAAQDADRPIILSINAVWCYWCHQMDAGAYADDAVIRYVNAHFVPVRVDTDHRPDINARYNVGGWPTTSFLTPHGGYIAGATYLPADQFLAMLDEVRRAYADQKPQLYEQGNDIRRRRREHAARVAAGPEPDAALVDQITRRVAGAYDPLHGGFGLAPKFPSAPMLRLLLHRYRTTGEPFFRTMLEKSLDGIVNGALHDSVDGGFFRFVAGADWTQPQHEKMGEDNIALASILLDAAVLLERPDYRNAASDAVDYIIGTLYDADAAGIRGSQGAHSDYFGMMPAARAALTPPPVDPFCYASLTAQGASLLLGAVWKLGRPELADIAAGLLDGLVNAASSGRLGHTFTAAGFIPQDDGDLLVDWAYFLLAALDGCDALPDRDGRYRTAAVAAADILLSRFLDGARGGFYDIEDTPDRAGYLQVREKPLAENVAAINGLLRLHHLTANPLATDQRTGNARYRQAAHHAVSAYVEANRDYGELAADYAIAVDRYLNPVVEVTVEGRPGAPDAAAMLAAAMALDRPHLIIKLVASDTDTAAGATPFPAQAHICLDTVCYPPVSDPAQLAAAVSGGGGTIGGNGGGDGIVNSPFQNVLDLLG